MDTLKRFRASAENHPQIKDSVSPLQSEDDIRQACWQLDGPLTGWNGYMNRFDGYAHSANAVAAIYRATRSMGVQFFLGDKGAVDEIVYNNAQERKSVGIRTKDREFHPAALVIVAAGAAAGRLVPEIGQQIAAKSWSVAHVRLSDEETSALRGIPVTYARDLGFFFEPDPKTNLLKLCPMGGGYLNTDPATGVSHVPSSSLGETNNGFIPEHDESQMRELLAQTLPALADRPLVNKSLCWFADSDDSDFIVDYVPQTSSSVVLLSGDSGHGFKMFPIVGSFIVDLLNARQNRQPVARWRWKEPKPDEAKSDSGGQVSWRLGESKQLSEVVPSRSSKL